jgi:hypothetical protein
MPSRYTDCDITALGNFVPTTFNLISSKNTEELQEEDGTKEDHRIATSVSSVKDNKCEKVTNLESNVVLISGHKSEENDTFCGLCDPISAVQGDRKTQRNCTAPDVRDCIQKFPDLSPDVRNANGTALCH